MCARVGYVLFYTIKRITLVLFVRVIPVLFVRADLENHNKDGGLWVVVEGRVYDVQDWKSQAPCGADNLQQYAAKGRSQSRHSCLFCHSNRGRNVSLHYIVYC